jgi:hypothetical protein
MEKITIFDMRLDDVIIEVLKLLSWPHVSGKEMRTYQGTEIRFLGIQRSAMKSALMFVGDVGGERRQFSVPWEQYESAKPMGVRARSIIGLGQWVVVDRDFVLEIGS